MLVTFQIKKNRKNKEKNGISTHLQFKVQVKIQGIPKKKEREH
jgi:hypothetical protein